MSIKIEKVRLPSPARNGNLAEFLDGLKELKVGESFVYPVSSYHRMAASVVQHILARRFRIKAEGDKWRVGRVL